ncbi:MAG: nodX [Hyphomicrobiales bacterium]|nr:nodX [Hyphomicrobiales bacterium]
MRTIGSVLDERGGIASGFDFLRIALSLSILGTHSALIVLGNDGIFQSGVGRAFHSALVPMFFALSGFLITGSAMRLKLRDFLLNRGMRILPALAMDIMISAMILGPLLTSASLHEYFTAYEFRAYFANVFGIIHYVLPGVFEATPFPQTVNGSLWTVPFELGCYAIISTLIVSGSIKRTPLFICVASTFMITVFWLRYTGFNPLDASGFAIFQAAAFKSAIHHFTWPERSLLYIYFVTGSLAYVLRHRIPMNSTCAAVAALTITAVYLFPDTLGDDIALPALVYLTVAIGASDIPAIPLYSGGDYSYGIYLYGFPLQQSLVQIFPGRFTPMTHFMASIILVTAFAMASWHLFEKPILRVRRKFSFTARQTVEGGTVHVASSH